MIGWCICCGDMVCGSYTETKAQTIGDVTERIPESKSADLGFPVVGDKQ
jgi:hypothetical protein